jgi:hypothetical protein
MNRIVLLAILVASMVLPLCQIETGRKNIVTQGREMIERSLINQTMTHPQPLPVMEGSDYLQDTKPAEGVTTPPSTRRGVGGEALILIYLAGLIICWLRYFWQMAALLLMIHRSNIIKVDGVPNHVHVVTNPDVKTPCSWMRWVFLNPTDAELISPLSTRDGDGVATNGREGGVGGEALLKHELAHIRLGHSWDMLLCELTCRMLWFVPFAWMLRQDLRDVHEYQADRRVLQGGIRDEEYQLLLIKKATSTGLQPVVNAFNQSPIKRRFKMMYRKPSRRWVALKAAYLLPLSALAVVAFARPQTLSEIEEKVETEVAKAVAPLSSPEGDTIDPAHKSNEAPSGAVGGASGVVGASHKDTVQAMPDANLVNADLAESGNTVLGGLPAKTATELLDSTMQAVGARKIADGTYIGHFQPNLNSDTVRIAHTTILDRQSQQTDEHLFAQNAANPYAYNVTLNAETRKERTGYYIRYLQPANSTVRNYDKKEVDPLMLSTDSVLTKRSFRHIYTYTPAAIERNKKDTRVYMYVGFRGEAPVDTWRQQNINHYSDYAIVDELTGDKYVCRATDYDYFKYVKDETITYVKDRQSRKDTIKIYQTCLVFPPLGKNVKQAYFGPIEDEGRYSNTFDLTKIPRKGRVITN